MNGSDISSWTRLLSLSRPTRAQDWQQRQVVFLIYEQQAWPSLLHDTITNRTDNLYMPVIQRCSVILQQTYMYENNLIKVKKKMYSYLAYVWINYIERGENICLENNELQARARVSQNVSSASLAPPLT